MQIHLGDYVSKESTPVYHSTIVNCLV